VLAQLTVVAPVSTELMCVNCHSDTGDATTRYPIQPTGKVERNILALHDYLNADNYSHHQLPQAVPLMNNRPVLCASCHSSNALGTPGVPGIKSLSNAMHFHHKDLPDITPDTEGCYNCHPGPNTQCLRDTMSQNFSLNCTNCHGTMEVVAQNTQPWLVEPKCSNANCHGAGYDTSLPLYRESQGHGGIYCEGCHDSTHAIAPSREYNDTIKFLQLQGHSGTLRECTVCHATKPTAAFKHAK
jgi:nitrate/TMAO reductase-like tetraheme cytochrome c subunit